MPTSGSVTHWLQQLGDGDAAAVQLLWERYFQALVRLADLKLRGTPRGAADEEDVALSAFDCFCRLAVRGKVPQLRDRQDLWFILLRITTCKAMNVAKHERAKKRDFRRLVGDATPTNGADSSAADGLLEDIAGHEPTPAFAALAAEEYNHLMDRLTDDNLRRVAVLKMEGCTNAEIAAKIKRAKPTVERHLNRIRKLWAKEKSDDRNSSID